MMPELIVAGVVVTLDCGFLERPVHSLDLTVRPRVEWLGQAVLDAVLGAGELEAVGTEDLAVIDGVANERRG
jgi:hypothetical protein